MLLVPDKRFLHIASINAGLLAREHVKGLVLDIDYTLADRSTPLPDSEIQTFITALKQADIRLYVLSNNHHNRVSRFARALQLPYRANGLKPFPLAFSLAVKAMNLRKEEVVAVGDQIYTDVLGGHLAGLRVWMVAPYGGGSHSPFFRLRRMLEKPFIHARAPEDGQAHR
ncbi:MAG: YqeG family HAD IIIA-type phosphatase [Ethanoligenens sp.]